MITSTRSLAIVVLTTTTLVSCSMTATPAPTPTNTTHETLRIYASDVSLPLVNELTDVYGRQQEINFETRQEPLNSVIERFERDETLYYVGNQLLDDLWSAPIAQDGIAIVTHPENRVDNLSLDQLRRIYQGQITNWQELGGDNLPIQLFSHSDGTGFRSSFENQVMGQRRITRNARVVVSDASMIDFIATTPGAIGYASQASVDPRVKLITLDHHRPDQDAILSNQYPLRAIVFIMGKHPPQAAYREFIAWIQSPAGQAVVSRNYVPIMTVNE